MLKDFLESVGRSLFDLQLGLFRETPEHLLYPSRSSDMLLPNPIAWFEFAGCVLAKVSLLV